MQAPANQMQSAAILFKYLPSLMNRLPKLRPSKARLRNHSQETPMQASANRTFSEPPYCKEETPMMPIVSKIACGLPKDTPAAIPIWRVGVKASILKLVSPVLFQLLQPQ